MSQYFDDHLESNSIWVSQTIKINADFSLDSLDFIDYENMPMITKDANTKDDDSLN